MYPFYRLKAVEAFQAALELNPTNALLAVRIGRALISTHDYRRAREYYDAALKSPHLSDQDRSCYFVTLVATPLTHTPSRISIP